MYTVENPGEGIAQFFAKIPGVNALWAKSQWGKYTILGFIWWCISVICSVLI
jgi:hypothetical protein